MLNTHVKLDSLIPALGSMRRELERAFDDVGSRSQCVSCPLSVWHDDDRLYIEADVPGFSEKDLELNFEDEKLWIRGERLRAEDRTFDHNERRFGKFERAVVVSDTYDPASIDASLDNGVLSIVLSKRPEAKPRTIEIRKVAAPE